MYVWAAAAAISQHIWRRFRQNELSWWAAGSVGGAVVAGPTRVWLEPIQHLQNMPPACRAARMMRACAWDLPGWFCVCRRRTPCNLGVKGLILQRWLALGPWVDVVSPEAHAKTGLVPLVRSNILVCDGSCRCCSACLLYNVGDVRVST